MSTPQFTVVSTFAGMGGSSLGYKLAGGRVMLAVEFDRNAIATYRANHPTTDLFAGDIAKLSVDEALARTGLKVGELDILDGSPPCQGFSTAGKRRINDPRSSLFKEFIRLLVGLKPRTFVMENVKGMTIGKMRLTFAQILTALREAGYRVTAKVLNASHFGVPQSRNRLIFIGVRADLGIEPTHPAPQTGPINALTAIGHLVDAGGPPLAPCIARYWPRMKFGEAAGDYHPKGSFFNAQKIHPYRACPTITKAHGSGRLVHWAHPRHLSTAELLILSSFPPDYTIIGGVNHAQTRVGNCVPPGLMRAVAAHIFQTVILPSRGAAHVA